MDRGVCVERERERVVVLRVGGDLPNLLSLPCLAPLSFILRGSLKGSSTMIDMTGGSNRVRVRGFINGKVKTGEKQTSAVLFFLNQGWSSVSGGHLKKWDDFGQPERNVCVCV